ncbi:MAG TPA: hypothetical protein VGN39_09500 [Terriglobales bacterium]|nr:hypothetical protein [Terriglobales bacterium]
MPFLVAVLLTCTFLMGQNPAAVNYPYLLHLETMNFDDQVCVLLRQDGQFHLEHEKGSRTRVFEGALSDAKMQEVQTWINDPTLRQLTEKQIVPPTGAIMLDELHVDIFRGDRWQDLFFVDDSSRRPFEHSIAPLVRWLQALPKEPHKEISEDMGKNDCQLPKKIVLKVRKPASDKDAPNR